MPRLSLPDGSRVRRESEVRRAFDHGRSAASGDVVVYAFDRGDGRPPRYALVVGRRWGGAVVRNRVRRLLRESFRTARASVPCGLDVLLLPRGRLEHRKMPAVREMLTRAVRQAVRRLAEATHTRPRADSATQTSAPATAPATATASAADGARAAVAPEVAAGGPGPAAPGAVSATTEPPPPRGDVPASGQTGGAAQRGWVPRPEGSGPGADEAGAPENLRVARSSRGIATEEPGPA